MRSTVMSILHLKKRKETTLTVILSSDVFTACFQGLAVNTANRDLNEGRHHVKLKSMLGRRSEIKRNLQINSHAGVHLGCVLLMNNQLAERKGSHLLSVRPNEFIEVLCKCSLG